MIIYGNCRDTHGCAVRINLLPGRVPTGVATEASGLLFGLVAGRYLPEIKGVIIFVFVKRC